MLRGVKASCVGAAVLLAGCVPPAPETPESALELVEQVNLQLLPDQQWQLSDGVIQLSFCRNRINESLMASEEELRRWRYAQDVSSLPKQRQEGLQHIAHLYAEHEVLLWQVWGTFSSQLYRVVAPVDADAPSIHNALALLGRDPTICYSSLDSSAQR